MSELDKKYDAIVIGSGAAGSIAVKELTERGLEVLLLEAGRDLTEEDFVPPTGPKKFVMGLLLVPRMRAMLKGQHIQSLRSTFNEHVNHLLANDRENPYTMPFRHRYLWIRGRLLGGRLNTYGRALMRMSDLDFKAADHDGQGANWPITHAELAPYYDRVEEFIGVHGDLDGCDVIPDGKFIGPGFLTDAERHFKQVVESRWPGRRVIAWRYATPNLDRIPKGVVAARATGRLTTRTDAVVHRITLDDATGLANGVEFIDRVTKERHFVAADTVMLCASAIESVRIMLNSATAKHPHGIGNSSGLLGRFFMDQVPSVTMVTTPNFPGSQADTSAPADPFHGAAGGPFVPRFENVGDNRTPAYYRGFGFQGVLGRFPTDNPSDPGVGGFMGFGEMLPHYDNRITLSPRVKDAWGIPVAHVRCAVTRNERRMAAAQLRAIRDMVEAAGFEVSFSGSTSGLDSKDVWPGKSWLTRTVFRIGFPLSLSIGAAIHECGGARMGDDPRQSVLDPYNRVWDVPNVYVSDGACFVTGGSVGPTLTIMALSARAAESAAAEHARTHTNG